MPRGVGRAYFSLYSKIVLIFFPYSCLALMESRIPLGLGLWAPELLRVSLVLTNRFNTTESVVFLHCRFSLFPDYLCSCKLIMKL